MACMSRISIDQGVGGVRPNASAAPLNQVPTVADREEFGLRDSFGDCRGGERIRGIRNRIFVV